MEPLSLLGLAVVAVLAGAPDARDVIAEGDVTWVATTGGVVRLEHGAHRTLSTRDGLPDGTVRALLAGGAERVWVGTDRGVAALDREGRVERVLRTTSPVTALASDGDAGLYVGTLDGLWHLSSDASLEAVSGAPRAVTDVIAQGERLYVSSQSEGVRVREGERWRRARTDSLAWDLEPDGDAVLVATSEGLVRLDGTRRTSSALVRAARALPVTDVRSVRVTTEGALVGTCGAGAFSLRGRRTSRVGGAARCVHAIHADQAGVRIASAEGAFDAEGRALLAPGLPDDDVAALARTDEGLWIGTFRAGLALLRADGSLQRWGEAEGLVDERINRLAVDAEGDLWIATDRGVMERRAGRFELRGLIDRHVVMLAPDGDAMLAGSGDDVLRLGGAEPVPLGVGRRPQDALRASDGTLVVASAEGLILGEGASARRLASTLPDDWTTAVASYGDALAVGTYASGVALVRGDRVEVLRRDLWVNAGAMIALGPRLCVGTLDDGLWIYDGARWGRLGAREGLPDEDVTALVSDGAGGLWVATRGGVAHLAPR